MNVQELLVVIQHHGHPVDIFSEEEDHPSLSSFTGDNKSCPHRVGISPKPSLLIAS